MRALGNLVVTRVDPQKGSTRGLPCLFAGYPNGGYARTGSELNYAKFGIFVFLQPFVQSGALFIGSLGIPFPIGKHQNIGAGQTSATRAGGQGIEGMKGFLIDFDPEVRGDRPNLLSALIHALEVHEGAMAFGYRIFRKT